jgi:hypothetical protein
MSSGTTLRFAPTVDQWPVYDPEELDDTFADYSGPLLMVHGGLDYAVSFERLQQMMQIFSAEHQTSARFPDGQHVVLNDDFQDCVGFLYVSFLLDPEADLDLSCIDQLPPRPFVYDDELTEFLFGTTDLWGDNVVSGLESDVDPTTPGFSLHPSYPNPWVGLSGSKLVITYSLDDAVSANEPVDISVYDILGREIVSLVNSVRLPGNRSVIWDGTDASGADVAGGIYVYRLTVGARAQSRLLTVIR